MWDVDHFVGIFGAVVPPDQAYFVIGPPVVRHDRFPGNPCCQVIYFKDVEVTDLAGDAVRKEVTRAIFGGIAAGDLFVKLL